MNRMQSSLMRSKGITRLLALSLALSSSAALAGLSGAGASVQAHRAKTLCTTSTGVKIDSKVVCKGLRYFNGKTIALVAGGAPGGSFDALARVLQPELQQYLGATVNVVNVAASATAQDEVEAANPNGLTIGELNCVPDAVGVATNQPVVNFNPARTNMIGAEGANADLFIATKSSPFQTFASLVKNTTAANPVQELALASGYDTTVQLLVNAAFGIHAHIITGYVNEAAVVAGFNRGDGQLMFGPLTATGPLVAGNKATSVVLAKAAPTQSVYYPTVSNVSILRSLEQQYPATTTAEKNARTALNAFIPAGAQVLFVARGVPSYIVQTLIAAMYWTVRTPQEKQAALKLNLTPGWQSPTTMRATYNTMLRLAPKLASIFTNF